MNPLMGASSCRSEHNVQVDWPIKILIIQIHLSTFRSTISELLRVKRCQKSGWIRNSRGPGGCCVVCPCLGAAVIVLRSLHTAFFRCTAPRLGLSSGFHWQQLKGWSHNDGTSTGRPCVSFSLNVRVRGDISEPASTSISAR